jgi:SAM-dependent methyltransferase
MENCKEIGYYRKSILSPIADILTVSTRSKIIDHFYEIFPPSENITILDLGVTSEKNSAANFLERVHPFLNRITCAATQKCEHLELEFPGVTVTQLDGNNLLPFPDNHFDIVYSNAVVEHVGSRELQKQFISEALRVAKSFYITTPNRWFPVELHTHIPLLHYLRPAVFRRCLELFGEDFYSKESNLNLLSKSDFYGLFDNTKNVNIKKIRTLGMVSNLCAYGSVYG